MSAPLDVQIEPYEQRPTTCTEHDPATTEVADLVRTALQARMPALRVEHVGSTAVPGCAGKGIVDVAVLYPPGQLAIARELVDALGVQHQPHQDPFPEDRPMRVGALTHAGRRYVLHVHVIAADGAEAASLLHFRDALRSDSRLRQAYVACKQAILTTGVTDSADYAAAKGDFIRQVLDGA